MGKTYTGPKGARELQRDARPGMRVYYINDHANVAGQFEAQTYSTLVCTHKSSMWGWMFSNASDHHGTVYSKKGTISAESAALYMGGVSTTPPRGLRELASPEPDCRDEGYRGLGRGGAYAGRLDTQTLDYIEGHAKEAEVDRARAGKRKPGWLW
ncbi:hypothetical protein [Streptomyces sp. WM6349]|uniref:hypothetical protein n=1 Tax=Streptomyces sp. WM6349 TaxID=1415552 RepID=UPI0006AF32B6|nr:hypothetical protein [Streptomyces sp. WM6349]KOU17031.1 hypothetical protein ADK49_16970 [Streptomyces sp. WM6349]